jgi:2-keto-4-pentenoate hydratase/2-oxohepta-3-ene-1,7-dioic acid hydratase in catechol pathway
VRLLSYGPAGQERAGFVRDGGIVDLERAMQAAGFRGATADMRLFLERPDWRAALDRVAGVRDGGAAVHPSGVRIGPPVPLPRKLMIAGANTVSHMREAHSFTKAAPPKQPMILAKATSALCGPADDIVLPPETAKLDYEVELAVVIGRTARRIHADQVPEYLAGYAAFNDVSARDVQLAQHEDNAFYRVHFFGKSFDTFAPLGPHLVTTDEIPWGEPLTLRTWVNGQIRQDGDTADLYFGIAELVAACSAVLTLHPGDIIATGSPAGVAYFMTPPGFLRPDDLVECEVGRVGRLANRVRAETQPA